MSINSKKLDRILKRGGPLADQIRGAVPKSMIYAHRRGAVPTLPFLRYYEHITEGAEERERLRWHEWASSADNKRHAKRIAGVMLPRPVPDCVYDVAEPSL